MKQSILVLLRHGQSEWNKNNLFTGWVDIPLSSKGVQEALHAGREIQGIDISVIYTSTLVRAQQTAFLTMSEHSTNKVPRVIHPEEPWSKLYNEKAENQTIPTYFAKELNERMYGELQGKNKDEMRKEYGPEQVHIWRRSFDVAPPNGESLKMTCERTLPYFKKTIIPHLEKGENVLVSAHGNSLRAIVMFLDNLNSEEVVKLEIPTGKPICYTYKDSKWDKCN